MKKSIILICCFFLVFAFNSCEDSTSDYVSKYTVKEETEPNAPSTYSSRPNEEQGEYHVTSRNVTFYVWDDGNLIDGDIISLIVNNNTVIDEYELKGPGEKKSVNVTLDNNGYNWVLLYAHNEGTSPPNTCAVTCDDGSSEQKFNISSRLDSNGFVYIIVDK